MTGLQVIVYLFQFLIYMGLMWFGFHQAGMDFPSPVEAPWLWAIAGAAPLIPWHWGDFYYSDDCLGDGFDGADCGD